MILTFSTWLENQQQSYYWASNGEFADGEVITAGDKTNPHSPTYNALDNVFERIRAEHYPNVTSRIGALFLAPTASEAMNWKKWGKMNHVYEVGIVTGEPYITDASIWSDAHYNGTKPGLMMHPRMPHQDIADWISTGQHPKEGEHPYHHWIKDYAHRYWNGGNEWWHDPDDQDKDKYNPLEQSEHPELLLPKGSQIRIVRQLI